MCRSRAVEDTISILRGLKEKYELHHGVRISDAALVTAATLSNRYISDRFLPDKAIDLIDEAASRLRMQVDSKPEALDELDRRIMQLKIEREALKKEKDTASKDRLAKLEKEIVNLEEKANALTQTLAAGEGEARLRAEDQGAARPSPHRARAGAAARRSRPRRRARLRRDPRPRGQAEDDRGGRGQGRQPWPRKWSRPT